MSYQIPPGDVPLSVPTSPMAVISLVAGILGISFFPLIGSIVAVITGPMAKREIQNSHGALSGEGLATAGIVLGWIGIALSVVGICVVGAILAIPLCLIPFGVFRGNIHFLAPALFSLLF